MDRRPPLIPWTPFSRQFWPASNLVFGPKGKKVFARSETGSIQAYPIPSSPGEKQGYLREFKPSTEGDVVAVGWYARRLWAIIARGNELYLESFARKTRRTTTVDAYALSRNDAGGVVAFEEKTGTCVEVRLPDISSPLKRYYVPPGPRDQDATRIRPLFLEGACGAFLRIEPCAPLSAESIAFWNEVGSSRWVDFGASQRAEDGEGRGARITLCASDVLAVAPSVWGMLVIGRPRAGDSYHVMMIGDSGRMERRIPLNGEPVKGFLCEKPGIPNAHLLALETADGRWFVATMALDGQPPWIEGSGTSDDPRTYWTFDAEPLPLLSPNLQGARAVGLAPRLKPRRGPGVLFLQNDGRTLTGIGLGWQYTLPRANAEIAEVSVEDASSRVVYLTVDGELVVHSLYHGAELCRLRQPQDLMGL